MPIGQIHSKADEKLWERAKRAAADEGQATSWALVNHIFQQMKKAEGSDEEAPSQLEFEKAAADESKPISEWRVEANCSFYKSESDGVRRAGGVISTSNPDQQGETVLQHGLDFTPFLTRGWLNDNHGKSAAHPVGYPESVTKFAKGETLPDGEIAVGDSTWMSAIMLDDPHSIQVWEKAVAAAKTGRRRYGWSLEGDILARSGPSGRVLAKALVKNVALTHCPVNVEATFSSLMKSLEAVEAEANAVQSALNATFPQSPTTALQSSSADFPVGGVLRAEQINAIVKLVRPQWDNVAVQKFTNLIIKGATR